MSDDLYVKGRDKNQLLADLNGTAMKNTEIFEQIKSGIIVRCTEDIEKELSKLDKTIDNNAKSNDNLSKRIFALNIILTIATVAGVIISGIALFCK
jgi:hypothetical protein